MPNVGDVIQFKRGNLASFQTLQSGGVYEAGTFYFVETTNRLYLAKTSSELVDLNQCIHVATTSTIPATAQDGEFYYLTDQNIFCRYDSTKDPAWTQINPNTALNVAGSSFTIAQRADHGGANITQSIKDTANHEFASSLNLVAGQNIKIDVSGSNVTINADDQSTNTQYDFTAGTDSQTNTVELRLAEIGNASNTDVVEILKSSNSDITVAAGTNSDTGNPTITIGGARNVAAMTQTFGANGSLVTTLTDARDGQLATSTITPTLVYGETGGATATFASGTATLDVYTTDEVDTKINNALSSADAMSYKGTIGNATEAAEAIPAHATIDGKFVANMGDTYKATGTFTYGGETFKAGDLIVAGAVGDEDGAVTLVRVPSGDDQLLSFSNTASTNPSILVNDGISNRAIGGIAFATDSTTGASAITYSASTNADSNQLSVQIRHGSAGATASTPSASTTVTQAAQTNRTVDTNVVTGISLDMHGHVTSATVENLVLSDTHANIDRNLSTVTAQGSGNNRVNYLGQVSLDNQRSATFLEFSLMSDNLTITPVADADNAVASALVDDHAGAKKPTIKMNLEWGSF